MNKKMKKRLAVVSSVAVLFDGALSEDITDGSSVVLTGSMTADGKFAATDVALEA